MAISETEFAKDDFEKESHYFHPSFELTPEEELVLLQHNKVKDSLESAAEDWAEQIIDDLYDVANIDEGDPGSKQFYHYFMLEDELHAMTHQVFANKLGIDPLGSTTKEELLFTVGNIQVTRQAFYYDQNDPRTVYGVSYVASPVEAM